MRGDHHLLAVTTSIDEVTGETKPLFAFPIQVCKATDGQRDVKFEIAAPSGAKRVQQYIDPATENVIGDEDVRRGVYVGDSFHEIAQESIDAITEQTQTKTMFVGAQMPRDEFFHQYGPLITGKYWVQSPAKGGSHKAYKIVYEALRRETKGRKIINEAKVLLTKRTPKSRLTNCAIYADEDQGCLALVEFAFVPSATAPDEQVLAPQQAEVAAVQVEQARTLINAMANGREWCEQSDDDAIALKRDLIDRAVAGEAIAAPTPVAETKATDDLTALLEASLAAVTA